MVAVLEDDDAFLALGSPACRSTDLQLETISTQLDTKDIKWKEHPPPRGNK